MPYQTIWVEPELFMEHKGVKVYHTYKDDDIDQGTNRYWFTCSNDCDEESFDVRSLPGSKTLDDHPPFLSASANKEFDTATPETKEMWRQAWDEWNKVSGTEDCIIRAILSNAIDQKEIGYEE